MKPHRLTFEGLEDRTLLAASFGDWHNESNPRDIDGDGYVRPRDVLRIINLVDERGNETVEQIQHDWQQTDADASELYGGFHPDVDGNGRVTPRDILQTINRIATQPIGPVDSVIVMPDEQGAPVEFVYVSRDGREHRIDVSGQGFVVAWDGDEVSASRAEGESAIMMRPGVGVLEGTFDGSDGQAVVTRFENDGTLTTERYVCGPLIGVGPTGLLIGDLPELPGLEVEIRTPIQGFEEVIAAMVMERNEFADGVVSIKNYEEGAAERLISLQVGFEGEDLVTVDTRNVTDFWRVPAAPGEPSSASRLRVEQQLLELVRSGYAASSPVSILDIDQAWRDAFGA